MINTTGYHYNTWRWDKWFKNGVHNVFMPYWVSATGAILMDIVRLYMITSVPP